VAAGALLRIQRAGKPVWSRAAPAKKPKVASATAELKEGHPVKLRTTTKRRRKRAQPIPPRAPVFDELHLRWYDRWLRGVDNGLDAEAPVRIFVMGGGSGRRSGAGRLVHGGRWRDEHEWPLARTRFTDFYLHGDGSLTTDPPRAESSAATYRFDPARPVPSIGGNVSPCATCCRCPGIADRATPAAASGRPTSCARAASTSERGRRFMAAARRICRWALAPTSSSSRPSPCGSPPR
jgi:hypothetical protein